jgi:hypothetical protein
LTRLFACRAILIGLFFLTSQFGCGGKLAKTGLATVTDVSPAGAIRVQYQDGHLSWKRISESKVDKDSQTASKNRFKPAKFIETKNGSTLTFPGGDTIAYSDVD